MSYTELILEKIDEKIDNTKNILINIKHLVEAVTINNIHELFYFYCYLLWNGYFSYNKNHMYSDVDIETELDYSIEDENTIFIGKGVCGHYALFLNTLLNYLNYDSKFMDIELNDSKINPIINIKRNVDKRNSSNKGINHRIVINKNNNTYLILDPTNLCEHEIINNKRIYVINGEYNIEENSFRKELDILYGKDNKYPNNNSISKELLIKYYKETKDKILKNNDIIEEFYNENKPYYIKQKKLINFFKL